MIKAYGYLRVSCTGQVEGDGFDRQRELIRPE
jgi:DNA invertase Pin-like site-specific DNA recombinase